MAQKISRKLVFSPKTQNLIHVHDKKFDIFIGTEKIQSKIKAIAEQINQEYIGKDLVFISILNGSFMFTSDLIKKITLPCEISFVKVSSYQDLSSSGRIDELIGLNTEISNKHVIIIEDIVDTGITMNKIYSYLQSFQPASLKIVSLLFKPDAFEGKHQPDIIGFSIPNIFVIGFGLDYNQHGRNFENIYKLIDE